MKDGVVENPKYYKKEKKKLAGAQKKLSRGQKGSRRRERQKRKVQKIHARIYNRRHDFLNRLTSWIVSNYESICIEDLNVSGMMKNHHLAGSVGDAGFYEFRRMLEYKAQRNGAVIHYADRFYPSSKRCSVCGHVRKDLSLSDRKYVCPKCGLEIDRDRNAAVNLLKMAQ